MDTTNELGTAVSNPLPLSNPPPDHRLVAGPFYESYEELESDLSAYTKAAGYAIAKKRSNKYVNGKPTKVVFACAKGAIRPSKSNNIRKTATNKVDCTWEAQASSLKANDWLWEFKLCEGHEHHTNHEAIKDPSASAPLRGLTLEMKGLVDRMSLDPGIRPRSIATALRKQFPGANFVDKDIHNYRQHLRKQQLDGYTPTQALIRSLEQEGILHYVYKDPIEEDRVTGCIWFEPWCVEMWRKYPGVLSFDATYKTNKYKMPLFTGTVVTPTKTVANIVYGFIDNERFEAFDQIVADIERARVQLEIPSPEVIITNYDDAERAAFKLHMPTAKLQLCVFHINKNIVLNVKKLWKKPAAESTAPSATNESPDDENDVQQLNAPLRSFQGVPDEVPDKIRNTRTDLFELWKHILYARTEGKFEATWELLKRKFGEQEAIIAYINREYMGVKHEWAACFTSINKNYGQRTIFPTETTHRDLKSYLVYSRGDLLKVRAAIREMIDKQQRKISTAESIQVERLRREYIGTDWLGELPRQVSYYCVDLLAKQHRKALGSLAKNSSLGPCTDLIKEQYGIPCAHDMLPKLEAREVIEKAEIDPYWWLDRDLADEYPHLRIQNPDVVINTRGRPRNHGAFGEETPVATQQPWSTQESRQKQLGRSLDSHPMSSSVRRRLSQWEHGESLQQLDTADAAPSSTPATASQRRRGRPPGSKNKPKPTVPAKRARDQGSGHGRAIRRTVNGLRKVIDEEEEDDDYSDESE